MLDWNTKISLFTFQINHSLPFCLLKLKGIPNCITRFMFSYQNIGFIVYFQLIQLGKHEPDQ